MRLPRARLQPFWRLHSHAVAAYERTRNYMVPVAPEVRSVQVAGETKTVEQRQFRVTGPGRVPGRD